tara:strand:+ start:518 stop:661 length:144 start_codon:yes stop_codon:yes gene_type:complete
MSKQEQQKDQLRFQNKKMQDQAQTIQDQAKRIAKLIEQQQDPKHNQE